MKYIDNMTDPERYIYGFLVAGADEYVENESADTTALTFRLVARDEDDNWHLAIIEQFRCGRGWASRTTMLNEYGDEPWSVVRDGWHGEVEYDSTCVMSTWLGFKDMHVCVLDAVYAVTGSDDVVEVVDYVPSEWAVDGGCMVRVA